MRALDLSLVSTKQQRIAELAEQAPQMSFTSLNHHIDFSWMAEAYQRTRKVRGHCQYYGVRGNSNSLEAFRHWTVRVWHKWLGRRKRDGRIPWSEFTRLLERYPIRRPRMLPSVAKP